MLKVGSILIILGFLLLFLFIEFLIIIAYIFMVAGTILILIGVIKDRYREYKEDIKNNDYRKY